MSERVLGPLASHLPPRLAASVDQLRPGLADGFGGPFNGQQRRIEVVLAILGTVEFRVAVETGTFRGTTTRFLSERTPAPIATVESDPRYYYYSRRRLADRPNVRTWLGDSAAVIRTLRSDPFWARSPAFFYLDAHAHWEDRFPVVDELEAISGGWPEFAALIDDFRVPDDPGYGYDDYGGGKVLDLSILRPVADRPLTIFWPAAPSAMETGSRRGWVVLATRGSVADGLAAVRGLRGGGSVLDAVQAHGGASGASAATSEEAAR